MIDYFQTLYTEFILFTLRHSVQPANRLIGTTALPYRIPEATLSPTRISAHGFVAPLYLPMFTTRSSDPWN
jgi:hypothetical protein